MAGSQPSAWQPPASDTVVIRGGAPGQTQSAAQPAPWQPPAGDTVVGPAPVSSSTDQPWAPPASDTAVTSDSPLVALRNSAGDLVSGVGRLGAELDEAIQRHAPAVVAKALGATGDLQNGDDQALIDAGKAVGGPVRYDGQSIHRLASDATRGNLGGAAYDVAGALASAAPDAAVALIPGAGPAILGAAAAGNTIDAREKAQGESSPSTGDVVAGTADGIVNAVGGGVAHGVVDGLGNAVLSPLALRLLGPLASRYAGRIATGAAAGGALGAANNVAANAGTGNMTAGGVLNDAVEGAGTGAVAAVAQAPKALTDRSQARAAAALNPEQAASIQRVSTDAAKWIQAAKSAGHGMSPADALKSLGSQMQGEVAAHVTRLAQAGDLSQSDRQAVVAPLMAAAKAGALHPSDAAVPGSALQQLDSLTLSPGDKSLLRNGLLDLSTINREGSVSSGLLRPLVDHLVSGGAARAAEAIGGGLLGFSHAGVPGAILGGLTGAITPRLTTALAGGADALLGANSPGVIRQQAVAQAALQIAGLTSGPSTLTALQAARQAAASGADGGSDDGGPSPAAIGAARAATNQAGLIARLGPDHPVGKAALTALKGSGNSDLAAQALAQWQAMSGIRDASAAGTAHDTAIRHQARLDAAGETPGGPFGIDAINAATRELGKRAQETMRMAGGGLDEDANTAPDVQGSTPGGVQGVPGSDAAGGSGVASTGSGESPTGLGDRRISLGDYLRTVALTSPAGVALSPAEIANGIDAAAAAGQLTPDQHAVYHAALGAPLDNPGGLHNGNLNAILSAAIAAKTGAGAGSGAALQVGPLRGASPGGGLPSAVRDIVKYGEGAKSNRVAYLTAAAAARSEGRTGLEQAALHALATSDPAARKALFDVLAPGDQARAEQLLAPALRGQAK